MNELEWEFVKRMKILGKKESRLSQCHSGKHLLAVYNPELCLEKKDQTLNCQPICEQVSK